MKNTTKLADVMKVINKDGWKESETYLVVVDSGDGYGGVSNCNMKEMCSLITHAMAEEMDSLLNSDSDFAEEAKEIIGQFELFFKEAIELVADSLRLKWIDKVEFVDGLHSYIAEIEEEQWYERGVRCNDKYGNVH